MVILENENRKLVITVYKPNDYRKFIIFHRFLDLFSLLSLSSCYGKPKMRKRKAKEGLEATIGKERKPTKAFPKDHSPGITKEKAESMD